MNTHITNKQKLGISTVVDNNAHVDKTEGNTYPYLDVELIKRTVAAYFGISIKHINSHSRLRIYVIPRHIAIYIAAQPIIVGHYKNRLCGLGVKKIGRHFGGRDHSTILSSIKAIQDKLDINDEMITIPVHDLLEKLRGNSEAFQRNVMVS